MFTDAERIRIACDLVRQEREVKEVQVVEGKETSVNIPVRGITVTKLLETAAAVSTMYHARKEEGLKPNFEQIVEDMALLNFKNNDQAQHIAKHVLGHYFAWRRNGCMPEAAHTVARNLGYSLL